MNNPFSFWAPYAEALTKPLLDVPGEQLWALQPGAEASGGWDNRIWSGEQGEAF